jgi:sRNA-binding protein
MAAQAKTEAKRTARKKQDRHRSAGREHAADPARVEMARNPAPTRPSVNRVAANLPAKDLSRLRPTLRPAEGFDNPQQRIDAGALLIKRIGSHA